jgi:TPR repeat protein
MRRAFNLSSSARSMMRKSVWGAAAEAGDTEAAVNLGVLMVRRGDVSEAQAWWRRAAEAGDTATAAGLAVLLERRGEALVS